MDIDPQRKGSFVSGFQMSVPKKLVKNCDRESADRQTDTQTDKHTDRDDGGDLIICPMICYSNGTDNYYEFDLTKYLIRILIYYVRLSRKI